MARAGASGERGELSCASSCSCRRLRPAGRSFAVTRRRELIPNAPPSLPPPIHTHQPWLPRPPPAATARAARAPARAMPPRSTPSARCAAGSRPRRGGRRMQGARRTGVVTDCLPASPSHALTAGRRSCQAGEASLRARHRARPLQVGAVLPPLRCSMPLIRCSSRHRHPQRIVASLELMPATPLLPHTHMQARLPGHRGCGARERHLRPGTLAAMHVLGLRGRCAFSRSPGTATHSCPAAAVRPAPAGDPPHAHAAPGRRAAPHQ